MSEPPKLPLSKYLAHKISRSKFSASPLPSGFIDNLLFNILSIAALKIKWSSLNSTAFLIFSYNKAKKDTVCETVSCDMSSGLLLVFMDFKASTKAFVYPDNAISLLGLLLSAILMNILKKLKFITYFFSIIPSNPLFRPKGLQTGVRWV